MRLLWLMNRMKKIMEFSLNISFIDLPLGVLGEIFPEVMIRANALGKYHYFRKYFAEYSLLLVYK